MAVTDFPHVQQMFTEAYARLVAMKLFALRAADYMRSASLQDRRYLLFNPVVKMKVTTQGEEVINLFEDVYEFHPFTHVSKDSIYLKQVVNTNKCVVQPEKVGTKLVVHSIIDNLLKGASGQAVQNMNLMFGIDECAGLELKASYF
jgi:N-acetyl-gamma-glutamylphosphate reductase